MDIIFALIPGAILILMTYFLYRLQRNSLLQEYRGYLESQIQNAAGLEENVIFYSKIAERYLRNYNPLTLIQSAIYILAYCLLTLAGWRALLPDNEGGLFWFGAIRPLAGAYLYLSLMIVIGLVLIYLYINISVTAKDKFANVLNSKDD